MHAGLASQAKLASSCPFVSFPGRALASPPFWTRPARGTTWKTPHGSVVRGTLQSDQDGTGSLNNSTVEQRLCAVGYDVFEPAAEGGGGWLLASGVPIARRAPRGSRFSYSNLSNDERPILDREARLAVSAAAGPSCCHQ